MAGQHKLRVIDLVVAQAPADPHEACSTSWSHRPRLNSGAGNSKSSWSEFVGRRYSFDSWSHKSAGRSASSVFNAAESAPGSAISESPFHSIVSRCSVAVARTTSRNSKDSGESASKSCHSHVRFLRSYEVRIAGTSQQNIGAGRGRMGRQFYHVQVSVAGSDEVTTVLRRYSEFARLHKLMRPRFEDLPDMPPKSQLRRRASGKFLDNRQEALDNFLGAAVAVDPAISDLDFQLFLEKPAFCDPLTRSGFVTCCVEDEEEEDVSTQSTNSTLDTDLDKPDPLPGVFRARERTDSDSDISSRGSDSESEDEVDVPRTFEIFARLDELQATNATLQAENKVIIEDLSQGTKPPSEAAGVVSDDADGEAENKEII